MSLTARYVSHPTITFGPGRAPAARPRLGLGRGATVYHRPSFARHRLPTVAALRPQTSGFNFPTVGRPGRVRDHRAVLTLGSSRARRA
ncbi:MAG TPA: hypothetical protein VF013_08805 [Candidatus Limnocylindria bacterium]